VVHAQSLADCVVWGLVALVVQILAYWLVRLVLPDLSQRIAAGETAAALFLGAASLAAGILNASAMTY
jgi:putative membrane protein